MNTYIREILPPPEKLVTNGICNMGTFNGPIACTNPLDAERPLGFKAPRPLNYLRLKEWIALQITNDEWFICLAVYNSKSLGIAIVMAYNKIENRMYRYEKKVPFWQLQVPSGLMDAHCCYHSTNFSIDIHPKLAKGIIDAEIKIQGFEKLPDLYATFTGFHTTEPIVIVQPFGKNRPLYSHKALMPLAGYLTWNGKNSVFHREESAMILDDHKGYYPYEMEYDWVTAMGYDAEERLIGFNLTHNQIQNPSRFNENCLWLDGRMHPLPAVTVKRPKGVEKPWLIKDTHGMVNLKFTPLKDVAVLLNFGVAATRYHGPTGSFEGTISLPETKPVSFDGFIGMGEKKYIRM